METMDRKDTTPTKRDHYRLGRAYNIGRVHALLHVGKTLPEIAEILGLKESSCRKLSELTPTWASKK